jgi:PadR family transcriptional regulator, regulatory protein PadR
MQLLSRSEELMLLAIWKLQGNAYGVTIRKLISEITGFDWALGAVYMPLDKLVEREFVVKYDSAPVAQRGGRSKCMYRLTEEGKKALLEIREIQESMWKNTLPIKFDSGF